MKRAMCVALGLGLALQWDSSAQQVPAFDNVGALNISATTDTSIREWDPQIDTWLRSGELRRQRVIVDTLLPDRTHERLAQYHNGIPVFGAEITRQLLGPITVSMFGTVHSGILLDLTPGISAEDAKDAIQRLAGSDAVVEGTPTLTIFPGPGGYSLCYRAAVLRVDDELEYFVDADTGTEVFRYSNLKRQTAVGRGTGVLGDAKKISVMRTGGVFFADDRLRPPAIFTFDMRGDPLRTLDFLLGRRSLSVSELAGDTDNEWTDGAAVDAHVYAGWVYDYYFKRFGRRGLDDRNFPIVSLVHPVRREAFSAFGRQYPAFFANAAWSPARRAMLYGVGLPRGAASHEANYMSGALDVVAHELTHGLTEFSSNLFYVNESGALNEAFSDILGTGAEFFFQQPGSGLLRAEYLIGEDVFTPGGIRSMRAPRDFGEPDHRSLRCCVGNYNLDNGGVHINSGIPNNAFFLAIEGGRNTTSGLSVEGVGAANREQIERIFYRAFVFLLPRAANFLTARSATLQAARDLYGTGSRAERAVTQAWDAVGVTPRSLHEVSYWPNPVSSSSLTCNGVRPSWQYVVSLSTAQTALTVTSFDVTFYDGRGSTLSTHRLSSATFGSFFDSCGPGTNRIGSNSEACSFLCTNLGGRTSGRLRFEFNGVDGNNRSVRVSSGVLPLVAGRGLIEPEGGQLSEPTVAKQH